MSGYCLTRRELINLRHNLDPQKKKCPYPSNITFWFCIKFFTEMSYNEVTVLCIVSYTLNQLVKGSTSFFCIFSEYFTQILILYHPFNYFLIPESFFLFDVILFFLHQTTVVSERVKCNRWKLEFFKNHRGISNFFSSFGCPRQCIYNSKC